MNEVDAYEARTRFAELLADVKRGHRVIITKHGRPVAMLSPIPGTDPGRTQSTIAKLRENRKGLHLGGNLRSFVEEGRR